MERITVHEPMDVWIMRPDEAPPQGATVVAEIDGRIVAIKLRGPDDVVAFDMPGVRVVAVVHTEGGLA